MHTDKGKRDQKKVHLSDDGILTACGRELLDTHELAEQLKGVTCSNCLNAITRSNCGSEWWPKGKRQQTEAV